MRFFVLAVVILVSVGCSPGETRSAPKVVGRDPVENSILDNLREAEDLVALREMLSGSESAEAVAQVRAAAYQAEELEEPEESVDRLLGLMRKVVDQELEDR